MSFIKDLKQKIRKGRPKTFLPLTHRMNNAVRVNLVHGIETFKRRVPAQPLLEAWQKGDYHKIMRIIPWDKMDGDLDPGFKPLNKGMAEAGGLTFSKLPAPIRNSFRWDIHNPYLKNYLVTRKHRLIVNITSNTRDIIQDHVNRAFTEALSPRAVANQIKSSIGLYPQQEAALRNYRAGLTGQGMNEKKVEYLSDKYEERLLDYRSMMIARTETRMALNNTQLSVWKQGQTEGLLPKTALKSWEVDGDPCEDCIYLGDLDPVGLHDPWLMADGTAIYSAGDAHPHCFTKGHLILTSKGQVQIENMKTGDYVLSHKGNWRKVLSVFKRNWEGYLIVFSVGGRILKCTPEHPFLVNDEWIAAQNLVNQDQVKTVIPFRVDNNLFQDTPIKILRYEQYKGDVYNLEVDIDHSYTCEGVVTHNCQCGMELVYDEED